MFIIADEILILLAHDILEIGNRKLHNEFNVFNELCHDNEIFINW
jgi:hypothetical protein